jgi:hypothetical protein
MKLVKMSLAAAMLMGVSAYAVENVKISGDANVFYATADAGDGDLFDKNAAAADTSVNLDVSADLTDGISAGASYTMISTLGLENNFVSGVWAGSHTAVTSGSRYGLEVENASWFTEAWVAATLGKTTAKIGRMELDTPLAFTETWSIEKNTFEAAVLLNQDLPDTTLVAAWVGNGNGTEQFGDPSFPTGGTNWSNVYSLGAAVGGYVNADGEFTTYGTDGAYAFGIVNNSFKPLTVQAWYYDVTRAAQAYWLQADLNIEGIMLGGQYANVDAGDLDDNKFNGALGLEDNGVYAVMAGYSTDMFTIKAAYSSVDDSDGVGAGWNTATNTYTAQSKLYTEAWWNYGYVGAVNASTFNITATATIAGFDLGAYYTSVTDAKHGILNQNSPLDVTEYDMNELTITAGTSFGPLDATLAYINTDAEDQNEGDAYNMVQAYLTLNF